MNSRMLKAKMVGEGFLQKDLAQAIQISPKQMCVKMHGPENHFRVEEMLILAEKLHLTYQEFDGIFFDGKLAKCLKT